MKPRDHLVSLRDLARKLKISATWLRSEADADRLPHLRAGRQYLFDELAVRRVLLERASKKTADSEAEAR